MHGFPDMRSLLLLSLILTTAIECHSQYCYPTFSIPNNDINFFQINNLIQSNPGTGTAGITIYDSSQATAFLTKGQTYFFLVADASNSGTTKTMRLWIDLDNSQTFDANEIILTSNPGNLYASILYTIPNLSSLLGRHRVRMMSASNVNNPCSNNSSGECIDLEVFITDSILLPQYCIPISTSNSSAFNIETVQLNTLRNCGSGYAAGSYVNYPEAMHTTELELGKTYEVLVGKGTYAGISGGFAAWIDFNNDYQFTGNELILISANNIAYQNFSIPNDSSLLGKHRLRLRSNSQSPPTNPCGIYSTSETEDYTISIIPAQPQDSSTDPPNRWEHKLNLANDGTARNAIEAYDKGFMVNCGLGTYKSEFRLLKLTTDGTMIWSTSENSQFAHPPLDMDLTPDGGAVICGSTGETDPNSASYLRKIGPCGNVEWTTHFGSPGNYDYAIQVETLPDSSYLVAARYIFPVISNTIGRMGLVKLSKTGTIEWQNDYTVFFNADIYQFIQTSDEGFLISATGHSPTPGDTTGIAYVRSILIKLDMFGAVQWISDLQGSQNRMGTAFTAVEIPGQAYLVAGYYVDPLEYYGHLAVFKVDYNGNLLSSVVLDQDSFYSYRPVDIQRIDDNIYVIASNRGDKCDLYRSKISLFTVDSTGNLQHSRTLDDFHGEAMSVSVTSDSKVVLAGSRDHQFGGYVYLARFNYDLSFDTLSGLVLTYDTLCDSTTLVVRPIFVEKRQLFELWPNPTAGLVHIDIYEADSGPWGLQILNMEGKLLFQSQNLNDTHHELDLSDQVPGIYLIRIERAMRVETKKLVLMP
jgi:hypothetical protein